jgi:hypothetical protein
MWELKELVRDFGYVNDFKYWYNIGAKYKRVIPLNIDANIVDFLNIVEMYKFEVVHLYVEHMVDHAIMINETFFFFLQTQVGEGGGEVDEVHMTGHEHGDGGVDEEHIAGREDRDGVSANKQFQNYQATMSKSPQVRVKIRVARKVTPSKKTTSTASVPQCEQPIEHPTTSRRGTNDYIIIVLCIIFDYFKLKMVNELMFSAFYLFKIGRETSIPRTPSKRGTSTASVHESEHPPTSRGGTPDYIIIVLYMIFDYFKLKIVNILMFSSFYLKQEEAHLFLGLLQREGPSQQASMKVSIRPLAGEVHLIILFSFYVLYFSILN